MQVLSVSNLSKLFGNELLFSKVNFSVNTGDRVAIIGRNGTGKSTLLKIILNLEESSKYNNVDGQVSFSKNCRVGYLSQDVIEDLNNTLLEEANLVFKDVIKLEKELEELSTEMIKNPTDSTLIGKFSTKNELFERLGGYSYKHQIKSILNKFGFSDEILNRKISSFSGGERTKMAFAKLLLINPDLLILDEPTNHLDVSTIEWLEKFLLKYKGAILFVSHDKYFINSIATKILELESCKITEYIGNFDKYVDLKKQNYESQLKAYNLQQKEIEKMKRFIEYFMPKPRFSARAKDRVKKLEHMDIIDKPTLLKNNISFEFKGNVREDKKIIQFIDLALGYDDNHLINEFSFDLYGGDKIAIVGDNGTGKTTFLKTILDEIKPISGIVRKLYDLNIGYLKQNDFDLKGSQTVIEYMVNLFPLLGEKQLRNHLGSFDFHGDDVFKSLDVLSGGEKTKLVLAKIVLDNYDVLLLDEPTNNLDMETCETLVSAMQNYGGCIIFVSHDRYFIDLVSNKVIYFQNKNVHIFNDGYQEFKDYISTYISEDESNSSNLSKDNRQEIKLKKTENKRILKEIETIEIRLKEIEIAINDEKIINDYKKYNELIDEKNILEEKYLNLLEKL